MKDVTYYLDKASKLDIGEEMSVNVSEGDGGWVMRTGKDAFKCYESTGYGSSIFYHDVHTLSTLKDFIEDALSWT
jgi:hypothetical protein